MIKSNSITVPIFLALAICVSCACEKSRELPPVPAGKFVRYAEDMTVSSKVLQSSVGFNILLPADYIDEPEKRYPVVYMFHGFGDSRKSWNDQYLRVESKIEELEEKGLLEPMIYVFPDGYNSYYCNTYDGSYRYMDMFIEEFVPFVDKTYRTIADRDHRAAVGYSMGGFGAMVLPMKHPGIFSISVPLSMSFRTDGQYMTEGPQSGWDNQWGRIFGGVGLNGEARLTDFYKEHCPYYQFVPENMENLSQVTWFLHCGDDEEQLLIANDDLHVQLRDNGYAHEYRVADGAHTSGYWRNTLDEVMPYIQFLMNGGKEWNYGIEIPEIKDVALNEDGSFCSKGASSADPADINAIYFAHYGLTESLVEDVISILSDGIPSNRKYMIFPCDLTEKGIAEWVMEYKAKYSAGLDIDRSQVVAFGETGKDVYAHQNLFSRLYFDNASLTDGLELHVDNNKFWFIGQTDDGPHYRDMGGIYKACKAEGATFQYRVRNGSGDSVTDMLIGAKTIKTHISY